MDNKSLQTIAEGGGSDCHKILLDFNTLHEKSRDFKSLDFKTKELLWDSIFTRLKQLKLSVDVDSNSNDDLDLVKCCLNTLRILSREKLTLEEAMTDDRVAALLTISGLDVKAQPEAQPRPMLVEGLKVIFNMVFQSSTLQVMFISNGLLACLLDRIRDFTTITTTPKDDPPLLNSREYPLEYHYFVTRILFLITALCQDTAPAKVRNLLNGLEVLNDYLELKIKSRNVEKRAEIICEVLKVLYNLIADLSPKNKRNESSDSTIDSEDLEQLRRATKLSRVLLLETWEESKTKKKNFPSGTVIDTSSSTSANQHQQNESENLNDIRRHTVDLLAALPSPCFEELTPEPVGDESEDLDLIFLERDISAVESTVDFLDLKLDEMHKSVPRDTLAPPLYALHNMATSSRVIRKYLKQRILPPLKKTDVENLPEVGKTTRNKLCSLLTSPISHITDLVANLLFVLCKENVGKLIKYAGYGNAAGLLANKGLMLGGKPPRGKYSDDDEDESDTEEYKEIEHMINQIEGRIQLERPNPMEGMTDEQKEFEAMKLINAIDKMERSSGIKPCKIGKDGRPEPIDHVMQLQDALENPMRGLRREGDSDSESD